MLTLPASFRAAVDSLERSPSVRVVCDWNGNGKYDHPQSDITAMVGSVKLNRGTATYSPEDLNAGGNGYSSGELTLELGGGDGDFTAYELFAGPTSPLYGKDITDRRIEAFAVFATSTGVQEQRIFSGFIREFTARRKARTVTLVANDHLDILGDNVTLPLWAVGTASPYATWNSGNAKAARSILLSWCWEETLRQAGRLVAPPIRSDAQAHWSLSGSLLPSVGRLVDGWATGPYVNLPAFDPEFYEGTAPFGWGTALTPGDASTGLCTAQNAIVVPNTSNPTKTPTSVGLSGWFKVDPSGDPGIVSNVLVYLEKTNLLDDVNQQDNRARLALAVGQDGSMAAAAVSGQPSSGSPTIRRADRSTKALSAGWHHYAAVFDMSTTIAITIQIDGATVTPTSTSGTANTLDFAASGSGGYPDDSRTNLCRFVGSLPSHHVSIWSAPTSVGAARFVQPSQITLPTLPNGFPMVNLTRSLTELSWIPDVQSVGAWESLKEQVGAEFGGLWMDANGTVHVASRATISATASNSIGPNTPQYDDSVVGEIELTPRADTKKNSVTVPGRFRNAVETVVWKSQGALDYPTAVNQNWNTSYPLSNVTAVVQKLSTVSVTPPANTDVVDVRLTTASAVQQADNTKAAWPGWAFNVRGFDRQRGFTLFGQGNTTESIFIGSYAGGQQPSIRVAGRQYSDVQLIQKTQTADADAAIYGTKSYKLPESDWRQTYASCAALALNLVNSYTHGLIQISNITLPHDPSRELFDVIGLTGDATLTGTITAQIVGIDTTLTTAGFRDSLSLIVLAVPGSALWDSVLQGWESNWNV
ncbi:hypothetical protein [Amycolatopsis orientalis]|uniref:hypothetical protein n=1 Tax=Amycolatopsis orientalis TaxID=31958 RepID=UPI0003A071F8|nr:hypothetical protein [Amycolatopsis orientalis]